MNNLFWRHATRPNSDQVGLYATDGRISGPAGGMDAKTFAALQASRAGLARNPGDASRRNCQAAINAVRGLWEGALKSELQTHTDLRGVNSASWQRCKLDQLDHKLNRTPARPILRPQSSEVTPRREVLLEQTGGRHGVFQQLAAFAISAGPCLVIAAADGILVRLETSSAETAWNDIALGTVRDEHVAGTNGVSITFAEGRDIMVRGRDQFQARLQPFACSAVSLRDAHNNIIGAVRRLYLQRPEQKPEDTRTQNPLHCGSHGGLCDQPAFQPVRGT